MAETDVSVVFLKLPSGNYAMPYTEAIPTATTSKLGGVIIDGTSITVNDNGVISANVGGLTTISISSENWTYDETQKLYTYTLGAYVNVLKIYINVDGKRKELCLVDSVLVDGVLVLQSLTAFDGIVLCN